MKAEKRQGAKAQCRDFFAHGAFGTVQKGRSPKEAEDRSPYIGVSDCLTVLSADGGGTAGPLCSDGLVSL